jgi:hypothetical protein
MRTQSSYGHADNRTATHTEQLDRAGRFSGNNHNATSPTRVEPGRSWETPERH